MRNIVFAVVVILVFYPGAGVAQSENPLKPTFVAKSTFVYLADSRDKLLQPQGYAYLPAGTRFLAFDKIVTYLGSRRRLILTETGLWAYIKDTDDHFWNPTRIAFFRDNEQVIIVRQRYSLSTKLSDELSLNITLTPSEHYRLARHDDRGVVVAIDNRKLTKMDRSVVIEALVPFSYVSIWDRNDQLALNGINPFEESVLDNTVWGISKDCDTTETRSIKIGGGFGIDISKYFAFLKLNSDAEIKRMQEFGASVNVARWYYKRSGKDGLYSVTRKTACTGTGDMTYSYNNADHLETVFTKDLAKHQGLACDGATGQVLVSCPDQYFRLESFLVARNYSSDEIPFIISRVAKFKDMYSGGCAEK
ncbi:MAG: hypothetical protein AB1512_08885 [Thermodesulfobacteriota bacterium]